MQTNKNTAQEKKSPHRTLWAHFRRFLVLLFMPSSSGFTQLNRIDAKKGYTTSYTAFKKTKRFVQATNLLLVGSFFTVTAIAADYAGQLVPSWAVGCSISADTTIDASYITTNSCDNITITSSAVVTFTEPIDLGGAGNYTLTVNSGVTATFSGALTLSDSGDAVQIDGTVTHAAEAVNGVTITAGNVTVSGTGLINASSKGCQGVATSASNGYGPNGSNVCTITTAGYSTGGGNSGRGGAGHGGAGGVGTTTVASSGTTYGSATAPALFGSSAGNANTQRGGAGGGLVRLNVSDTLTINGSITANGGDGLGSSLNQTGGGSGGSIYITTATFNGTPASITANGGSGSNGSGTEGGGGGGGRIAVEYTGGTMTPSGGLFTVAGGNGPDAAADGTKGTTYVKNTSTNVVNIYHGFTYDDTDYNVTTWNIDSAATNQYCATGTATPSITATNLTINGILSCDLSTITSFNLTASSSFTLSADTLWSVNAQGADMDWDIPDGNYTWENTTITGGAEGLFTIDDAVGITLTNVTVSANVQWTALTNLTVDATSLLNANSKGCQGVATTATNGYGPDGSNVCTITTAGYSTGGGTNGRGGAGHGGAGGLGTLTAAGSGITYGSATAPTLFGSSAGNTTTTRGGSGGGAVRINVSGTLTMSGSITANGGDGGSGGSNVTGGGSGGSIYITTATFNGTPASVTASGGAGVNSTADGGGGGGGRIAVEYTGGTMTPSGGLFTVAGGNGPDAAADGTKGTTYVKNTSTNVVNIYHGFTYDDTDYNVTTWNIDSAATNQYCATGTATPSITATNLTLNGILSCDLSTITSFNLSASSSFTLSADTLWSVNAQGADMDWDIPDGNYSWENTTITGGAEGLFTIDDAVGITLTNVTVSANVQWTALSNLTVDATSLINANSKGCQSSTTSGANGYGPNGSNDCTITTAGYSAGVGGTNSIGGAGHGGAGGNGSNGQTGGATYGSSTTPILFGSSSGNSSTYQGGVGGGYIRLALSDTLIVNGSITANGGAGSGAGSAATGGGSGGSIYVTTQSITGTPSAITANGGAGANFTNDGGGGGGGRIAVKYGVSTTTWTSTATAASTTPGGLGPDVATDGSTGTLSVAQYSVPSTPSLTSPTDGAVSVSRIPTITSSTYASDGAPHTTSDWQISDNNTFSDADCSDPNIVYCSLDSSALETILANTGNGTFQNALNSLSQLAPNTTYSVRVRHTNNAGDSAWSSAVSFTTASNTAPSTPTNATPADAATGVSTNPTLTASTFSDADSDTHASSDWALYESSDCSGTADWSATASSNLASVVVNTTNGTFADALAGKTKLRGHTTYSFQVRYTDGYASTSSYSSCTSFTTANSTPVFTGTVGDLTVFENQSLSGIDVFQIKNYFSDADFNDDDIFTCTATNDLTASLGTLSVDENDEVVLTLNEDANGSDTVQFSCADSQGAAATTNTFTITVTSVNSDPSFTKGGNQSILEDAGAQTVTGWATSISAGAADESAQTLTFNTSNDNNALFSVQPTVNATTGTLTYTPASNASGSATVTISLSDNGGTLNGGVDTSATQTFTITVTSVNDAPSFTKGGNITILEDAGEQTVVGWATSISAGAADESGQTLTFNTSNDNNALFSVQPTVNATTGTLTYTPASNTSGSATVTISLSDNGGTLNGGDDTSADQTFTITVTSVNDVPSFTKGGNITILEDAGAQTVTGWATSISAGAADESGQTLTFNTSNDNNALFSVQPTVNASTGTLTYTPASNASGSATVTISLSDNGGTLNGGVDTSATQTFTITVTEVYLDPIADAGADQTINEDDETTTLDGSGSSDPDAIGALSYSWSETADIGDACSLSNPTSVAPTVAVANKNSNYSCQYTLVVNNTVSDSDPDTVTLSVVADDDAPSLTNVTDKTVNEDDLLLFFVGGNDPDTESVSLEAEDTDGDFAAVNENITNLFTDNGNNVGIFAWTPSYSQQGSYATTLRATDGTSQATDSLSITVNNVNTTPEFTESLPASISFGAGSTTAPLFDLNDYVADEDGDALSFSVSGNDRVSIGIDDGVVTMSAPSTFNGSETVRFTVSDPSSAQDTSNAVIVTVGSEDEDATIDHVQGSGINDPGVVTVFDNNGDVVASWTAFAQGGAVAKYLRAGNTTYVFVIRRAPGHYIKVYTSTGEFVTRRRVSPKVHWQKIAIGQLDNNNKTIELILGTSRQSRTVYLKMYRFFTTKERLRFMNRTQYAPKIKRNYQIDIEKKVVTLKKNNKLFFLWNVK